MSRLEKLVCDSCGKEILPCEFNYSLEKWMDRRKYERTKDFCDYMCLIAWAEGIQSEEIRSDD